MKAWNQFALCTFHLLRCNKLYDTLTDHGQHSQIVFKWSMSRKRTVHVTSVTMELP